MWHFLCKHYSDKLYSISHLYGLVKQVKGPEMDILHIVVHKDIIKKNICDETILYQKCSVPSQLYSNLLCKFCISLLSFLQSCDFILHVATHNINIFLFLLLDFFFMSVRRYFKCQNVRQQRWLQFYNRNDALLQISLSAAG